MREKENSARVVLVRHAEPDFPIDRVYCDSSEDPGITPLGEAQAKEVANSLKDIDVAAIFSSPLLRTKLTAEYIDQWHSVEVVYDERLKERSLGVWDGLFFNEVEGQYPEEYRSWKKDQAGFAPQGGETAYDLLARVKPVIVDLVDRFKGRTVVVVCHVGPIRVLLADALGLPINKFRNLRIDPASVACVDYGCTQNNLIMMNFVGNARLVNIL